MGRAFDDKWRLNLLAKTLAEALFDPRTFLERKIEKKRNLSCFFCSRTEGEILRIRSEAHPGIEK